MYLRLTTFVALFALFTCAFSAPTMNRTRRNVSTVKWDNVKQNATRLNEIAKNLTSGPTVHINDVRFELVDAKDKCDPESLRSNSEPCLEKIGAALQNYSLIFRMIDQCNETFSKAAKNVSSALGDLMYQLGVPQPELDLGCPQGWYQTDLYRSSINRLFSFSILAARVFAPGNPAQHSEGAGTGGCL